MLLVQDNARLQLLLAGGIAASFAVVFVLTRYPLYLLKSVAVAAWPLHLFTAGFFGVCFAYHGGAALNQVIFYTLFGYVTYVLIPLVLVLDHQMFIAFVKLVAISGALLAIPSFWGALGYQTFLGILLRVKPSYADFSGIIASAGLFEHAEGHAFQMAIGTLCSVYALRIGASRFVYLTCFCFKLDGAGRFAGTRGHLGLRGRDAV